MADPPAPLTPPPAVQSSDGGFTFRIARAQEWTLGAVITAAVAYGIWMGTLNTKLEHIEKFVDSASDASQGIFVRLATIQKTLEVLDRNSPTTAGNTPSPARVPVIVERSILPNQPQGSNLTTLIEYKMIEDMLKSDNPGGKSGVAVPAVPVSAGTAPLNYDLSKQQALWLREIQDTAFGQLNELQKQVDTDKNLSSETKGRLTSLIETQRDRVKLLQP